MAGTLAGESTVIQVLLSFLICTSNAKRALHMVLLNFLCMQCGLTLSRLVVVFCPTLEKSTRGKLCLGSSNGALKRYSNQERERKLTSFLPLQ